MYDVDVCKEIVPDLTIYTHIPSYIDTYIDGYR